MLKSLNLIKDFGIFKNFSWTSDSHIEEFNSLNIIYGWNYSGKTTLSRVFSSLRDKELDSNYSGATIKINSDLGSFDNSNLNQFPYTVQVFNSDYVRDNLSWEFDEHINAIYFEVGDNAVINTQIAEIKLKIEEIEGTDSVRGKKEPHISAKGEFEEFEASLFTKEASRIKNEAFSSLIEFNKLHLKKVINRLGDDRDSHIIKSKPKLKELAKLVKIEEAKESIDELELDYSVNDVFSDAITLLQSEPSKKSVLGVLDSNRSAYEWVNKGLDKNKPGEPCLFCANEVTEDRFRELMRYFENEASSLKTQIDNLIDRLDEQENNLSLLNLPSSVNDLNSGFQDKYLKLETELVKCVDAQKVLSKRIKNRLLIKRNKKIYTSFTVSLFGNKANRILELISEINDLIKANNDFSNEFDTIIVEKRNTYQNHLVAKFLKDNKYSIKERKYDRAIVALDKLDQKVIQYNRRIDRLTASKTSNEEGCKQLDEFVKSFLSRDDIEVKLNTTTNSFNLMRGNELAKNLSEGEKMAISFSHFLVHVKSIEKKGLLHNQIVFIDDPISSLDSNHIFQINSLLREVFFEQIPDPNNPLQMMWNTKCMQFFVSTHNFEFFNLLKELPKKGFKKSSRYYVTREGTESKIQKLPKVYSSFSSEYHFLFGEIIEFNSIQDKGASPKLLTIPNILRRFVEMYTLTKYPSNETVDLRAVKVFGKRKSKRILKLLHHFSHFDSIDRIYSHAESIADIEKACKELVDFIKDNDVMHYNALLSALN